MLKNLRTETLRSSDFHVGRLYIDSTEGVNLFLGHERTGMFAWYRICTSIRAPRFRNTNKSYALLYEQIQLKYIEEMAAGVVVKTFEPHRVSLFDTREVVAELFDVATEQQVKLWVAQAKIVGKDVLNITVGNKFEEVNAEVGKCYYLNGQKMYLCVGVSGRGYTVWFPILNPDVFNPEYDMLLSGRKLRTNDFCYTKELDRCVPVNRGALAGVQFTFSPILQGILKEFLIGV